MAGRPPRGSSLPPRAQRARARPHVGDRAERTRGAVRRPGARSLPAGRDRGSESPAAHPAAHCDAGAARARNLHPRGSARVSAVSLHVVRPAPQPAVRPATLTDVPQLETLMAPYVATGDLLPRNNYDLCRHIKEYVVALGEGGAIIGCASLKVYSR